MMTATSTRPRRFFGDKTLGLVITVGLLSDLLENDRDGADHFRIELAATAIEMERAGLAPHREPEKAEVWGAEGYGYSGLHALREVAGLVWQGKPIPVDHQLTGDQTPASDALFEAALAILKGQPRPGLLDRLFGRKATSRVLPPFAHLVVHSDAQGFYVPTEFDHPIIPAAMDEATAHLWPLGSVQRLSAELETLAQSLGLPAEPPEPDDVIEKYLEAAPVASGLLPWQAQPIATYTLLILHQACRRSLRTGAAICFG
jgi:hypothetical protein